MVWANKGHAIISQSRGEPLVDIENRILDRAGEGKGGMKE